MNEGLFAGLAPAAPDPILGVSAKFAADTRENKVNLSVGVYLDDNGKTPVLDVVHDEEVALAAKRLAHSYTAIRGLPEYCANVQKMVFGADSDIVKTGRAATVQTLGGTGALKVGIDFSRHVMGVTVGSSSQPTWGNHDSIMSFEGLDVIKYRYYDRANDAVDFNGMVEDIDALPKGSLVILHSCCHNPTGYDLSHEQWKVILELCQKKGLLPFLDMAYQGFKEGLAPDAYAIRLFAQSGMDFLVATSYSKSFGLYCERVGALTVVTQNADQAKVVLSQLEGVIRCNYSNPPAFGGRIVQAVLGDPEKYQRWSDELDGMRERIISMRHALVDEMQRLGAKRDFSFVTRQAGMFSFTGFTPEQVAVLRDDYAIYALKNGRICICGLNTHNVNYVAKAFCDVL
ncbi:MAG TPA: aromatic amino acid aminotransferase [Sutterella sp.]|nr:aromatic amino acid aminotransferase [Sutterella sp.]